MKLSSKDYSTTSDKVRRLTSLPQAMIILLTSSITRPFLSSRILNVYSVMPKCSLYGQKRSKLRSLSVRQVTAVWRDGSDCNLILPPSTLRDVYCKRVRFLILRRAKSSSISQSCSLVYSVRLRAAACSACFCASAIFYRFLIKLLQ